MEEKRGLPWRGEDCGREDNWGEVTRGASGKKGRGEKEPQGRGNHREKGTTGERGI